MADLLGIIDLLDHGKMVSSENRRRSNLRLNNESGEMLEVQGSSFMLHLRSTAPQYKNLNLLARIRNVTGVKMTLKVKQM